MNSEGARLLLGAIIEQATKDARYLTAAAQGRKTPLYNVYYALDAPDWLLGPGLDYVAGLLDLPDDFARRVRSLAVPGA